MVQPILFLSTQTRTTVFHINVQMYSGSNKKKISYSPSLLCPQKGQGRTLTALKRAAEQTM